MLDINNGTRPDLVYEHMDATQMTYPDGKFSVVLDKGTLDALMPDTKEATLSIIDRYFKVSFQLEKSLEKFFSIITKLIKIYFRKSHECYGMEADTSVYRCFKSTSYESFYHTFLLQASCFV